MINKINNTVKIKKRDQKIFPNLSFLLGINQMQNQKQEDKSSVSITEEMRKL